MWKLYLKAQFSHSYGQIARNYVQAVPFHKIFHIRKLGETAVFYAVCVKLKVTLLNIIIRGGSGRPAISKMEHSVTIALH